MHSQSFTPIELYHCTTQAERRNLGLTKDKLIEAIGLELKDVIRMGKYKFLFRINGELVLNGQEKDSMAYLCQDLVLRKLHRNIKRIYSVKQADRNTIVKQMKVLLNEDVDMRIVRLDVHHFYDSINSKNILAKLVEDARLSYQSLQLIQTLFRDYSCGACCHRLLPGGQLQVPGRYST